uniref:Uncharacterized protein n=1 Tax=viral metagenome TaxID=1070528 RepID=A0A2V0R9N8_9ZZZZ
MLYYKTFRIPSDKSRENALADTLTRMGVDVTYSLGRFNLVTALSRNPVKFHIVTAENLPHHFYHHLEGENLTEALRAISYEDETLGIAFLDLGIFNYDLMRVAETLEFVQVSHKDAYFLNPSGGLMSS